MGSQGMMQPGHVRAASPRLAEHLSQPGFHRAWGSPFASKKPQQLLLFVPRTKLPPQLREGRASSPVSELLSLLGEGCPHWRQVHGTTTPPLQSISAAAPSHTGRQAIVQR